MTGHNDGFWWRVSAAYWVIDARLESARDLTRQAHSAARVKASLSRNSNLPACLVFELIAFVFWASACSWACAINSPLLFISQWCLSSAHLSPLHLLMGPK